MIEPMTTATQQTTSRRWVLPFLAAMVAALAAILVGNLSPASAAATAETRVGASSVVVEVPVGPPKHIGAGQRLGKQPADFVLVVATGVAAKSETELVQRWMSQAELDATRSTGLVRGGRDGTHYVTDFANHDPLRARQRLALPQTPEVRVQLEVPRGVFSPPKTVRPDFKMPGGGLERTATGPVQCRVVCVWD